MSMTQVVEEAISKPFGTVFAEKMAIAWYRDGAWSDYKIAPTEPLSIPPCAHVFHYSSSCFEGFKIHRWEDGSIHVFRLESHLRRFQQSSELVCLPVPDYDLTKAMFLELAHVCRDWVPEPPGSLYVRPTLIGTMPSVGAAAGPSLEACLFIILSPVGAYFKGGMKPLRILVEDTHMRTAPHFGQAKAGANYVSALPQIQEARENYQVDQVLFCPDGDVQETGAANFLLINDSEIMTKPLDSSFLAGVTRDSLLTIGPHLGYRVTERNFSVQEMLDWCRHGEAALSGTAAVLASIGTLIYQGKDYLVGDGTFGSNTMRLRNALRDIQKGKAEDRFGWLRRI